MQKQSFRLKIGTGQHRQKKVAGNYSKLTLTNPENHYKSAYSVIKDIESK